MFNDQIKDLVQFVSNFGSSFLCQVTCKCFRRKKFIERNRENLAEIYGGSFRRNCSPFSSRVSPQTIGQDPAASFRILSDLSRGIIPRLIVEAGSSSWLATGTGIHLHNYLLAGSPWRPVAHRFTARCSLTSFFFQVRFWTGILTSRPSYFFACTFFSHFFTVPFSITLFP